MRKIIDGHTHIFPDKIAVKASESIGHFYGIPMYSDASSKSLIEKEAELGVEKMLVCSSAVVPTQVESINSFISEECKKHPEFIGFGAMHRDYENYIEELDRCVELGIKGIKFHHDMQGIDIDDPKTFPIYKAMEERGLRLVLHMGDNRYEHSRPDKMLNIAKKFDGLLINATHFGGYQRWDESILLPKLDNVFYETSSSLPFIDKETAVRLIDHFGPEHFFFGTDFPMWKPTEEFERFMALGLSEEENQMILYDNFIRFAGL